MLLLLAPTKWDVSLLKNAINKQVIAIIFDDIVATESVRRVSGVDSDILRLRA